MYKYTGKSNFAEYMSSETYHTIISFHWKTVPRLQKLLTCKTFFFVISLTGMTEISMCDLSLVYSSPFSKSRSGRGRSYKVQMMEGKSIYISGKICKYLISAGVTASLQIWGPSVGLCTLCPLVSPAASSSSLLSSCWSLQSTFEILSIPGGSFVSGFMGLCPLALCSSSCWWRTVRWEETTCDLVVWALISPKHCWIKYYWIRWMYFYPEVCAPFVGPNIASGHQRKVTKKEQIHCQLSTASNYVQGCLHLLWKYFRTPQTGKVQKPLTPSTSSSDTISVAENPPHPMVSRSSWQLPHCLKAGLYFYIWFVELP